MAASAELFAAYAPLGRDVEVVREDDSGLIALAKPEGMLSHPNRGGEEGKSLLNASYTLAGEYYQWTDGSGQTRKAWLLNRLDSGTSGIVLLAIDEALAGHIRALFKTKRIQKIYAALVFGRPLTAREIWKDKLAIQKKDGMVRSGAQGNIPAESAMQLVKAVQSRQAPLSLIQLEPRTGRSHQLRVQCATRHLPIVGDATYGDFRLNRLLAKASGEKRLFLHSFRTTFDYDWQGKHYRFSAEARLPEAFAAAMRG